MNWESRQNDFVLSQLPDHYICGQCNMLLQEPIAIDCCGKNMCQSCYYNLPMTHTNTKRRRGQEKKIYGKQCPYCSAKKVTYQKDLSLKLQIDNLDIYCPKRSKGCDQTMRLADKECHRRECMYENIWCTNHCWKEILRHELSFHLENECNKRLVECEYCFEDVQHDKLNSHHEIFCSKILIPCPNQCGISEMKRTDICSHKLLQCPLEEEPCEYYGVGCTELVKRRDLDNHLKTTAKKHLSLITTAYYQLKEEYESYEKSMGPLLSYYEDDSCESYTEESDFDEEDLLYRYDEDYFKNHHYYEDRFRKN